MALFESCSKQVVKDLGRSSLHPVLDLNSASQCRVMCVVERKKSRWFWKSTKYLPTPFTLNELLTKPIDVTDKIKTTEFAGNYSNEPTLHVSGKLGCKLAKELGIDVSTADSFVVKMDLGTINKSEIRWQDLNDAFKDKTLNLDHEFVQAILNSKRRKLCIVAESLKTSKDTNIQSDLQVEGKADAEASVTSKATVDIGGTVQDTHHRSFDIPKDTVIAYGCYELNILEGLGGIELAVDKKLEDVVSGDATDGTRRPALVIDQTDGADSALTSAFNALMKSPKKNEILKCFREILASNGCLDHLELVLNNACDYFDKEKKAKSFTKDELKTMFGSCNVWEKLLNILSFEFDSKKGEKVIYPDDDTARELVLSCCGLATALHGLTSHQCIALKDLTSEYCDQLLYLIRNAMYGKDTSADDPKLKRIYTHQSNPGKSFLLALGFKLEKQKGKDMLVLPLDVFFPLEDAYVAVFVMASE